MVKSSLNALNIDSLKETKYSKVKKLYFEKHSQLEQTQRALEHARAEIARLKPEVKLVVGVDFVSHPFLLL